MHTENFIELYTVPHTHTIAKLINLFGQLFATNLQCTCQQLDAVLSSLPQVTDW